MFKELSEDLKSIKHIRSETKDTLQGNNNRMDEAESQISDLECRKWKTTNHKKKKKKKESKENKDSVSSLWDNFKHFNMHIIGLPGGKEKEQEIGNLFEKIKKISLIWWRK